MFRSIVTRLSRITSAVVFTRCSLQLFKRRRNPSGSLIRDMVGSMRTVIRFMSRYLAAANRRLPS